MEPHQKKRRADGNKGQGGLTRGDQHDTATTIGLSSFRIRLHHGQRGALDGKESAENMINQPFLGKYHQMKRTTER